MLRGLSARQFAEWQAYEAVEPFDETRMDARFSALMTLLANINRDPKRQPFTEADFRFLFGDAAEVVKPKTWQQMKAICYAYKDAF